MGNAPQPPESVAPAPTQAGTVLPARWDVRDVQHLNSVTTLRPEIDTALGGGAHLSALGDASPDHRSAAMNALLSWRQALESQAGESRERMLDVRVFAMSLELFRFTESELRLHTADPDVASGLLLSLLFHLRGHVATETERFDTLAQRLKALGRALLSARPCLDTPSEDLLARALDVSDGAADLLRAISEAAQHALASGAIVPTIASEVADAVVIAGAALDEHKAWLLTLSPITHVPMGAMRMDELLRLRGLDLRCNEVTSLARSVAEELRVEELRVLRRGYKGTSAVDAMSAARMGAPNSLGEAVSWLTELTRELRAFVVQGNVIPVPSGERDRLVVDVMPSLLTTRGQTAVLLPPQPLAPMQESLLLLREVAGAHAQSLSELSVADLENIAAHCGTPGMHLQAVWSNLATSVARRGAPLGLLSPVASTWGTDMTRGWALMAEEAMREAQFRHSPASRLVMVKRALLHAVVAAVDVALATGRLNAESAAALLVRRGHVRLVVARAIVRSLQRAPSIGLSAFVGKIRIDQLRREARKRWRDGFSERRFVSLVLASGPVPLAYLFDRLADPPVVLQEPRL